MVHTTKDHHVTREALALIGMEDIAYIRPMTVNGRKVHVIHAADGSILTAVMDRDLAFVTVRQHEMTPQSLH